MVEILNKDEHKIELKKVEEYVVVKYCNKLGVFCNEVGISGVKAFIFSPV